MTQIVQNDAMITQREREVNDIAKSISELAQIFNDLQTMVIDQGTLLDRIDYNVEQTVVHVKEGIVQLDQASCTATREANVTCFIATF